NGGRVDVARHEVSRAEEVTDLSRGELVDDVARAARHEQLEDLPQRLDVVLVRAQVRVLERTDLLPVHPLRQSNRVRLAANLDRLHISHFRHALSVLSRALW